LAGTVTVPRLELAATALAVAPDDAASASTASGLVTSRLPEVLGDKEFLSDVSCHGRPGLEFH